MSIFLATDCISTLLEPPIDLLILQHRQTNQDYSPGVIWITCKNRPTTKGKRVLILVKILVLHIAINTQMFWDHAKYSCNNKQIKDNSVPKRNFCKGRELRILWQSSQRYSAWCPGSGNSQEKNPTKKTFRRTQVLKDSPSHPLIIAQ